MTVKKSFGSKKTSNDTGAPVGTPPMEVTFNEGWESERTFRVRGQMLGLRVLSVIRALEGDSVDGRGSGQITQEFLEFAFLKEDREEALEYLATAEPIVDFPTIVEVVTWLVSEYTGNPTALQEQLGTGSGKNGSGSSEKPLSVVSTSDNSMPSDSGQLQPI